MNNLLEAINEILKGVNVAYSRGAYTMQETHDLHIAMEFIKTAATTEPVNNQQQEVESSKSKNNKPKEDY